MQLCQRCRVNKPTIHFVSKAGEKENVNVQLCEDCARPLMMRREAARHGAQECKFCTGTAFSPLPGVRNIIYACCGCRSRYSQIFFGICAQERPDLLERSERDISFFDMSFDPEVEDWADAAGKKAMQVLSQSTSQDACDPQS